MSWDELGEIAGYYITSNSEISNNYKGLTAFINTNIFPTKELAEASLALTQLLQLRDRWNEGWVADWKSVKLKYTIINENNEIVSYTNSLNNQVMVFKTQELRDLFLKTFKDLLEIAKPLL